mmetsp:Transcript_16176/g.35582  ORF Transcript_16176/g.35582 Transcript_16176/m.35582 type:complete len:112 (-) Transcript_16176:150-485(-)
MPPRAKNVLSRSTSCTNSLLGRRTSIHFCAQRTSSWPPPSICNDREKHHHVATAETQQAFQAEEDSSGERLSTCDLAPDAFEADSWRMSCRNSTPSTMPCAQNCAVEAKTR